MNEGDFYKQPIAHSIASRVGFDLVPDTLDVNNGRNYSRLNLQIGSVREIKREVRNALCPLRV